MWAEHPCCPLKAPEVTSVLLTRSPFHTPEHNGKYNEEEECGNEQADHYQAPHVPRVIPEVVILRGLGDHHFTCVNLEEGTEALSAESSEGLVPSLALCALSLNLHAIALNIWLANTEGSPAWKLWGWPQESLVHF